MLTYLLIFPTSGTNFCLGAALSSPLRPPIVADRLDVDDDHRAARHARSPACAGERKGQRRRRRSCDSAFCFTRTMSGLDRDRKCCCYACIACCFQRLGIVTVHKHVYSPGRVTLLAELGTLTDRSKRAKDRLRDIASCLPAWPSPFDIFVRT